MTRKSFNLFIFALAGIFFAGCHADVNLEPDKLSGDGEAQVKLSLPIGEIKTSFAEMIGLITNEADVAINDKDIIELRLKEHYESDFHAIDLTEYMGTVESDLTLQSSISALTVLPAGEEIRVPFDLNVLFSGVNDDTADERIDSMQIELARFSTKITKSADLMISDDDIQKVEMHLGPMFRRAKGTVITLPNFRLNENIPIEIDQFTLNMMKDENEEPSSSNVLNTANVTFVIYLKTNNNVAITSASGFHFSFKVEMMEYSALYGYFEPGKETRSTDVVDIPITAGNGSKTILPIANPQIMMKFTHGLYMPLDVNIGYIKTINSDETETYATWNGSTSPTLHLTTPAGDTDVFETSLALDSTSEHGQIDRFFEKEVKKIAYDYKIEVDKQREVDGKIMKQFRLTQNRKFTLDFECIFPFDFKNGLNVSFGDTIKDVSLEQASLDSLVAKTNGVVKQIEDADLYLYLTITNDIPVDLKLDVYFIDEKGQEIEGLTQLRDKDIIGAEMVNGLPAEGKPFVIPVPMKKADFEKLAQTRNIYFRFKVGNDQKPSVFYAHKELKIKMGVTADMKALVDMGALFK